MPGVDPCAGTKSLSKADQNVWLYNIKEDPSECVDLSDSHPDVLLDLLWRLNHYNSTAVPVFKPPNDSDHSAADTGGAWVPWVEEEN